MFSKNETFARAKDMMRSFLNKGMSSPKVQKLVEVLVDHFRKQLSTYVVWHVICPVNLTIYIIMHAAQCSKIYWFFRTTIDSYLSP